MEKDNIKKLSWRIITTVILTLTAVFTFLVYAAFVEPTAGPNDSDQDFAQNILGANNADNDFDSSLVTASSTGSIIERLEYITNRMTTAGEWYSLECDDSTTTATTTCYIDDTAKYVDTNACSAASNDGYCYMNTDTFSTMDTDLAAGNIKDSTEIFGTTGTYEGTVPDGWGTLCVKLVGNNSCPEGYSNKTLYYTGCSTVILTDAKACYLRGWNEPACTGSYPTAYYYAGCYTGPFGVNYYRVGAAGACSCSGGTTAGVTTVCCK